MKKKMMGLPIDLICYFNFEPFLFTARIHTLESLIYQKSLTQINKDGSLAALLKMQREPFPCFIAPCPQVSGQSF
jgi:hypothetical protein